MTVHVIEHMQIQVEAQGLLCLPSRYTVLRTPYYVIRALM
jgi:hypothetical protein